MSAKQKTVCVGLVAVVFAAAFFGYVFRPVADGLTIPPRPEAAQNRDWRPEIPATPGDISGNWFGYLPNQRATETFVASLPNGEFSAAAPNLMRAASDEKPILLYRYLYKAYEDYSGGKKWRVKAQGIGDCVSWGWAYGVDHCLAVAYVRGESGEWRPAATEAIYGGSRVEARGRSSGGWSDGSYGGAAAKWVRDWGVLWREDYPELGFDLSRYSSDRAKQWGNYGNGGRGDNGKADSKAKDHPVKTVALVTNFEQASKAIENGYPVAVCSGQGFRSRRDSEGFAAPSGSWSHCMLFMGVRYDRRGLLCLNSWGETWISGPKWPEDQPNGSFWVDERTVDRMLSGRDSFAISNVKGFPRRKLDHGEGWGEKAMPTKKGIALVPERKRQQWEVVTMENEP